MITKLLSLVLLITISTAASAATLMTLPNIPLGVYLLSIGSCAFVFLRKAISTNKETGVNNSQPATSKLHIHSSSKSIT